MRADQVGTKTPNHFRLPKALVPVVAAFVLQACSGSHPELVDAPLATDPVPTLSSNDTSEKHLGTDTEAPQTTTPKEIEIQTSTSLKEEEVLRLPEVDFNNQVFDQDHLLDLVTDVTDFDTYINSPERTGFISERILDRSAEVLTLVDDNPLLKIATYFEDSENTFYISVKEEDEEGDIVQSFIITGEPAQLGDVNILSVPSTGQDLDSTIFTPKSITMFTTRGFGDEEGAAVEATYSVSDGTGNFVSGLTYYEASKEPAKYVISPEVATREKASFALNVDAQVDLAIRRGLLSWY